MSAVPDDLSTIRPGERFRITDPNNAHFGLVLAFSHIENENVVRFVDPPFAGFGAGTEAFKRWWERE